MDLAIWIANLANRVRPCLKNKERERKEGRKEGRRKGRKEGKKKGMEWREEKEVKKKRPCQIFVLLDFSLLGDLKSCTLTGHFSFLILFSVEQLEMF